MPELVLDPVGYFLIRINDKTKELEAAFCKYDEIKYSSPKAKFGKNTVNQTFSSKDPDKILKWIKDNRLIGREDHMEYMKKELKTAKKCLEKGTKYIQD